jgi:predicted glycoside hydrolase/deacetylase ChbG (UPF0249 family)
VRTVWVNADDAGLHPDIDRGIRDGVDAGAVSGVSVVPSGSAPDWPLYRQWQAQGVGVGLHATLMGERWLTIGWLIPGWRALARRLALGRRKMRAAVRVELAAQLARCRDEGIRPIRLDAHQHAHLMPGVWPECLRLVRDGAVPRVRVPRAASPASRRRGPAGWLLEFLARWRARQTEPGRPCVGLGRSGRNTLESVAAELRAADGRDVELVVHPGFTTAAVLARYAGWGYDWSGERTLVVGPEFRAMVEATGYRLAESL